MLSLHAAQYSTVITAKLLLPDQIIVFSACSTRMAIETLTQASRTKIQPQLTSLHETTIRDECGHIICSHASDCHAYIESSYAVSIAEIDGTRLMLHRGSTKHIAGDNDTQHPIKT